MSLPTQLVRLPLAGISTKEDEKLVDPTSMLELRNAVVPKAGRGGITFSKRNGHTAKPSATFTGSSNPDPEVLASFKGELAAIGHNAGAGVFSVLSEAHSKWKVLTGFSQTRVRTRRFSGSTENQTMCDIASLGGTTIVAYRSASGVAVSVFDETSRMPIVLNQLLSASAVRVRCLAVGTKLHVIYEDGTALTGVVITPSDPVSFSTTYSITGQVTVVLGGDKCWDVVPINSTQAVFAYAESATNIRVGYIDDAGTLDTGPANVSVADGGATINQIGLVANTSNAVFIVAYNKSGTGLRCFGRNVSDLTQAFAPVTLDNTGTAIYISGDAIGSVPGTDWAVVYGLRDAGWTDIKTRSIEVTSSGTVGTLRDISRRIFPVSRAVRSTVNTVLANTEVYFFAAYVHATGGAVVASPQTTTFLFSHKDNDHAPRAKAAVALTADVNLETRHVSNIIQATDSSTYLTLSCANLLRTKLSSEGTEPIFSRNASGRMDVTFDALLKHFCAAECGDSLCLSGGIITAFGGAPMGGLIGNLSEAGFHVYPEKLTTPTTAGGNVANGTYQWVAVYEWYDDQGQLVRSAPSIPFTYTVAAGPLQLTFAVSSLNVHNRTLGDALRCAIVLYRTKVGPGSVFYRVSSLTTPTFSGLAMITNVIDNVADANLGELLYTTGGVPGNLGPPAATIVASGKNRLFLGGIDNDPYAILGSHERIKDVAIEFPEDESTLIRVDPSLVAGGQSGELTGLQVMDDNLIALTENAVFAISGDGPTRNGIGSFTQPRLVTTDTGCLSQRTVALTPMGTLFKGAKGFYLLTRTLDLRYIGEPVEAFNAQEVTGVVCLRNRNAVVITHRSGEALFYDYYANVWGTWLVGGAAPGITHAILHNGTFHYARGAGFSARAEDQAVFTDDGADVAMHFVTPWYKMAGIGGFQFIQNLIVTGSYKSAHSLEVQVGYDYASAYSQTLTYSTAGDPDVATRYQAVFDLRQKECEAVRFKIRDTSLSGTKESMTISALSLEVATMPGATRVRAEKRA